MPCSDREDSPDWLRSFQPPAPSTTVVSSDSGGASSDKILDIDYDDHTSVSVIIKSSSTNTTTSAATKRPNVCHDVPVPAKRSKTHKHIELGIQDDVNMDDSFHNPEPDEHNHSVWALSSDSDSHSNAAVALQPNQQDPASKVPKKGKSPNKHLLKPKEKNKTNSHGSALRQNEADEISPTLQVSESMKKDDKGNLNGDSTAKVVRKRKSPKKKPEVGVVESTDEIQAQEPLKIQGEVNDAVEERLPEKHIESRVSSSTLSLVLPEKVSRSKALVECEGESIDLSGDMGAVGRIIIPENPSGEHELFLDLKGTIYKTAIVPSRTFCVVSIGPSEAKIEAIMNDFIQLKAQSNVYDAETMVEGTLEGFSFDSEDEADKTTKDIKTDKNEEAEEQAGKKTGGKVEKKLGATQKKGKATTGKQPKKKKPQATKKSKVKK